MNNRKRNKGFDFPRMQKKLKIFLSSAAEYSKRALEILKPVIAKLYGNVSEFAKRISVISKPVIAKFCKDVSDFVRRIAVISKPVITKFLKDVSDFIRHTAVSSKTVITKFYKDVSEFIRRTAVISKPVIAKFYKDVMEFIRRTAVIIKDSFRRFFRFAGPSTGKAVKAPSTFFNSLRRLPGKKLAVYSAVLVVFSIFLLWFVSNQIMFAKHYWEGEAEKKFRISPGQSLTEIAENLKSNDIIGSVFLFKIAAKFSGSDNNVISRTYIFKNGISNSEIMSMLTDKSLMFSLRFTVPEGMRIKFIGKLAVNKLGLNSDVFINETINDSLINVLGLKGKIKNLEGFLFPDTYNVPVDITEKELVRLLFNEFRKKVIQNNEIQESITKNKTSLLSVIIMASIVQGETQLKPEMPTIAGVYFNRLAKRMKLEADPTIQYALPDGPKARLLNEDLKINSPYNTYKFTGLPPGPINNPGLDAIKAALNPEKHNYIFFVATGKGGHKFSETYSEHLQNAKEYRKSLEK
jgi:UPF0755 protein